MTSAGAVVPAAPVEAIAPGAWLRDWRGTLLLFAVGLVVLLPELVAGPSTSDSLRYNVVWLDQWRELVAGGNFYPRWMPRAWDGLGSPSFYFYPPLFFWVAVGLDQLTLRLLETGTLLSLTSAFLLGASGAAMRTWLRAHVGPLAALLGALAYLLAPYHIYDIFARAALAETCAYVVLPLVMLAMKRASEDSASAFPALALAYATLILAHLPVALLASVVLLPAYALFLTKHPQTLVRLGGAGLLGVALAAIYLLPALALTDRVLAEALSTSFYRPQNWFFWRPGIFAHPIMWIVMPACVAAALLTLSCLKGQAGSGGSVRFWAVMSIAIVLLVAGVPPLFWNLPAITLVQFPWRLMVLLEFATVTAVALAAPQLVRALAIAAALPLFGAIVLVVVLCAQRLETSLKRSASDIETIRVSYRDAPEYLPSGMILPLGPDAIPNPSTVEYPQVPLVGADAGARTSVRALPEGGMVVAVEGASRSTVVARRFNHGLWEVGDERGGVVRTWRTADLLVAWIAPAGRSRFHLRLAEPISAVFGRLSSGISLLVLLLSFTWAKLARQRRSATLEAHA